MTIHAAAMIAVFVDQMQQAPVVVQCPSALNPDPIFARFIFAFVPSIFALAIAWLVFVWNGGREQKQWVRDQKKAEWRGLLDFTSECWIALEISSQPKDGFKAGEPAFVTDAKLKLLEIDQLLDTRIFIDQSVIGPIRAKWREARERAAQGSDSSSDKIAGSHALLLHSILICYLREAAKKDLGIDEG